MLARSTHKLSRAGAAVQIRLYNEKAMQRKADRVPLRPFEEIAAQVKFDEDNVWIKPGPFDWPYFTFKETEVNYTVPSPTGDKTLILEQKHLTDAMYKEIEEKTTITKDNIMASQQDWMETEADYINYQVIIEDIMEMYLKGVPKLTINTYLNTVSSNQMRNWNFTRIDS